MAERTNEKKGYRNSLPPRDVTGEPLNWIMLRCRPQPLPGTPAVFAGTVARGP